MEFRLDEGQVELQETVRPVLRGPVPARRASSPGGPPARPGGAGRELADLGVFGPAARRGRRRSGPRRHRGGDRVRAARLATSSPARCCGRCWPRRSSTAPPRASGSSAASTRVDVVDGDRAGRARRRARRAARPPRRRRRRPPHRAICRRPTPLDPLDPLTPVGRVTGLGRRRRSSATRRRAARLRLLGTVLRRAMLAGVATPRARGGARLRPRARAVRRADRLVPGRQAPAGRHVRPQRAGPERDLRCRRGARRTPATTTRSGRPRRPSCSPARRPSPTPAPRSRCSAAWASPGTCSPTTSSSGPGCSSTPSAPADDHAARRSAPTLVAAHAMSDAGPRRRGRDRRRRAAHRPSTGPSGRTPSTRRGARAIVEALEAASTDDVAARRAARGTGDDFCSGADWVATNARRRRKPRTGSIQRRTPLQAHRLIALLIEIQLPVVCAVRGWAAGLGCQLALAADFTVAADDSRFWLPFIKRGFTPDSGCDLAAAPPRRRGPGQGDAAARAGRSAGPTPPPGG